MQKVGEVIEFRKIHAIVKGYPVHFVRRRYSGCPAITYTWVHYFIDNQWEDLGDPWPVIRPKNMGILEFIEKNIVNNFVKSHGFKLIASGGGCPSFSYTERNGNHVRITDVAGCGVPGSMEELCKVGIYDTEGKCLKYWDADNVGHALHITQNDVKMYCYKEN